MKKTFMRYMVIFIIILGVMSFVVVMTKKIYINNALMHLIEGNTKFVLFYSEDNSVSSFNSCLKDEDIRMYLDDEEVNKIIINNFLINKENINDYFICRYNILNYDISYFFNSKYSIKLLFHNNKLINAKLLNIKQ